MQTRREAIALLTGATVALAQRKPNFSGQWIIDTARTNFVGAPPDLGEIVDHRDPVLIVRSSWDPNRRAGVSIAGLLAPSVELNSGGATTSSNVPPDLKLKCISHWDGEKFVTDWDLLGLPNGDDHGTWTRYLTDDGRTMVVEVKASVQTKLVFTKK